MINIFTLFLLLLALWSSFVYLIFGFDYTYFVLGIVASLVISLICFNLKIINKKSELLYLSWGFYKYFIKLYFTNFFKQITVQIKMLFISSFTDPRSIKVVYRTQENKNNSFLFEATINFMAGYSIIEIKPDHILVGAINRSYEDQFFAKRIFAKIKNINDDNLV